MGSLDAHPELLAFQVSGHIVSVFQTMGGGSAKITLDSVICSYGVFVC